MFVILRLLDSFLSWRVENQLMDIKVIKQNKWAKRLLWVIGGVAILWGVAWLAVPLILKSQLEQLGSEYLGRKVTLTSVDFKPWSLELTLHDLTVARSKDAADTTPQLHIKRIYIDAELQSLVHLAPVFDAIQVDAPHVNLTYLGDGHYDVDDLIDRFDKPSDKSDAATLGFSLYNVSLTGGSMDFIDKSVKKTHALRDLQIKLPFLSNLDSKRAVLVQPQLAFQLNGSLFDASAKGTPFAQTHQMDATFKLADLDVSPYLGYVPASVPVKLTSALLNADLKLAFEQSPKMAIKLSGTVQADKVRVISKAAGPELLAFDRLKLTLADVRPLDRVASLAAVEWLGPNLSVVRNKTGQLNLALLSKSQSVTKTAAAEQNSAGAEAVNNGESKSWKLAIDKVTMRDGTISWIDESTAPVAHLGLSHVTLDASAIAVPFVQPLQFEAAANLVHGGKVNTAAHVRLKGSATDKAVNITTTLADLPLSAVGAYLTPLMTPVLSGTLNAEIGVNWTASADFEKPAVLLIDATQLRLDGVLLTQDKANLVSIKKLQVEQAQINLALQTVTVGKLSVTQPKVAIHRQADGLWMYESWLKTGATTPSANAMQATAPALPVKIWGVAIQDLALEGGAVAFKDKSTARQVAFELDALTIGLKNFSTISKKTFGLNVSTQISARKTAAGRLVWRGTAALSPLAVQGRVDAVRVPVHAFEPYLADALNIELLKAEASFKGPVSYMQTPAGPIVKVSGDSEIEEFQANSMPLYRAEMLSPTGVTSPGRLQIGEELLNWKQLSLRGLDLAMAPGKATTVTVNETVLSDFFARIILSETGRLNLQDVLKSSTQTVAEVPIQAASASHSGALNAIASSATMTEGKSLNTAAPVLKPVISFGPVSVLGGRVYFSDRFIKPNYSANLTELTGKLSAFSSQAQPGDANLADLVLRGRAEGTASLEILGKLNPLATPVALDIKGRVRDLELPPLSPYSVRYVGYGIERGKLSVDLGYVIQADGLLTASNNIVLNQLTFGEKVEGAPVSLPVKLAVALLADRNGVIDLNLPVSGSLNDPQFKLAPIVFKLIGNLIVKAITSPFSLLASALGGATDELSAVNFAPGTATLSVESKQSLDKVVKALTERPALKMTVIGTASLDVERDAYLHEQLKALVLAEKRRGAILSVPSTTVVAQSEGQGGAHDAVLASEYPELLKVVYRRADFPKPRNLIGIRKDLSVAEMEALLLTNLPATNESMRSLAVQRGVAVRDYLADQKLPLERLFLGAAKAVPPEAKWQPRAELNLTLE